MALFATRPARPDPIRQFPTIDGDPVVAAPVARTARPAIAEAGSHALRAIPLAVSTAAGAAADERDASDAARTGDASGTSTMTRGDGKGDDATAIPVAGEAQVPLTAARAGGEDGASIAACASDETDVVVAMPAGGGNSRSTTMPAGDDMASASTHAGNGNRASATSGAADEGIAATAVRAGKENDASTAHADDERLAPTAAPGRDENGISPAVRAGNGDYPSTAPRAAGEGLATTLARTGSESDAAATPRTIRSIATPPLPGRWNTDTARQAAAVQERQVAPPALAGIGPPAAADPCLGAGALHRRQGTACAMPAVAASAPAPAQPPRGTASPPVSAAVPPTADTVLWACFQFPALPLHAVFADEASGERPCALFEGPRQRPVVVHANEAAQARGVRPGLVLATARALCAELDARKREPDAERSALQLLATWAYRFSAQVSRGEPDTIWLEVGASLTLFNGWPALQRQLHAELQTLGFGAYRLGVAPIAAAARVLALSYEQIALRQRAAMHTALERTPIALSGLPAQSIAQLQGMGFRELRDLWRVPRLELTRRLGPAGMHTLAVLRGEASESLALYQPPDRFARRIELDALVDNWQPLLFPLRRLVNELARYLLVRDGGVQRFELRLEHEDRAATRIPVGLVSVQREAAALYEFCRGRLERASIGAQVSAIALIADDLPPFRPGHRDLFEPARSEGLDWPALTERLRSRLGDEALQQLACVADHRPERAWRFVAPGAPAREPAKPAQGGARKARSADARSGPAAAAQDMASGSGSSPGAAIVSVPRAARPLWLLPQPIPLRLPLAQILSGPERIESGWWDGGDVRRDYYVVRCASGQRAWAFLPAGAAEGWMLHGWFA